MAIFNFDEFAENLPDAFAKDKDSNNYKLLLVEKHIYDAINTMLQSVYNILDIDNATGTTLDMYGERLNLKRGAATDAQYLIRLKAKIAQNFSDGSRDSIAKALAYVLSTTTDRIKLKCDTEKNTVQVADIPLKTLTDAGFSGDEIMSILNSLLAQGVTTSQTHFSGTFEFSDSTDEYNINAGFADIDGTIGGYFGLFEEV